MNRSLRENLRILKSPSVEGQDPVPVYNKSKGTLMDLLGRAQIVTEGRVPANMMADRDKIIKELTEMAVREAPESPEGTEAPEDKTYFGSTGNRIYYALIEKGESEDEDEEPTIKNIKLYDVGDEEVWALENTENLPNIEVIYQAVVALSLDSISWSMLEDLGVLSMEAKPEEEEPKEEKPAEEKPEEEEPKEEKPAEEAPEEEEEVEEPVESVKSIKSGDVVSLLIDLVGPSTLKAGARGIVNTVESVEKITVDFKLDESNSFTRTFKLEEMKRITKKIVKRKKVKEALDLNQAPKPDPKLKMTGEPAKDPKVDDKGAEGTPAAPVKPKDIAAKADAGAPDPKLGKENVAAVAPNEKPLEDKGGAAGKQSAPVDVPKIEGATVVKESEAPSLVKDKVEVVDAKPKEVKQDVAAVAAGQDDLSKKDVVPDATKVVGQTDKLGEAALDVQKPDEYKDAMDKLQKDLTDGKITEDDFKNGKLELDKKFKAEPAGTTEAVMDKAVKDAVSEATQPSIKDTIKVGDTVKIKDTVGLFVVEGIVDGKVRVKPLVR